MRLTIYEPSTPPNLLKLEEMPEQFQRLCRDHKIYAIKTFRNITGCGLKEAKVFCEGTPLIYNCPEGEKNHLWQCLLDYSTGWYDHLTFTKSNY